MTVNQIKSDFEKQHIQLMALNPEVDVCILEDEDITEQPKFQITVAHQFIFDNRLVPSEYKGISVLNVIVDESIPEQFKAQESVPLWKVEAPHLYVEFVTDNIDKIRVELKDARLSEYDALEAITGGFQSHIDYWTKKVKDCLAES